MSPGGPCVPSRAERPRLWPPVCPRGPEPDGGPRGGQAGAAMAAGQPLRAALARAAGSLRRGPQGPAPGRLAHHAVPRRPPPGPSVSVRGPCRPCIAARGPGRGTLRPRRPFHFRNSGPRHAYLSQCVPRPAVLRRRTRSSDGGAFWRRPRGLIIPLGLPPAQASQATGAAEC